MIPCQTNNDCPFMYYCNQLLKCQHKQIFPLQVYTVIIYLLLIPLGCGLVNIVGKSMGLFKVMLMMNLLRYDASQSTTLIQPMVAGSALPNVISVIFKRHPFRNTSRIDFDIILVTIPCNLLGSTLGSFIQKLIPQIFKDIATIIFFITFAIRFYKKSRTFVPSQSQTQISASLIQSNSASIQNIPQLTQTQQIQRYKILQYQSTIHLKDILISIIVFIVFQFCVFLLQGKFGFYTIKVCSWAYVIGLALLVIIVVVYLQFIRRFLFKKFNKYNQLKIPNNIDLGINRNFGLICFGGYFAGLVQGILGVGSGTFIMGVFVTLGLHPQVAAATSGYQILFIGLAAFIQQFVTNNITLKDASFLFLLTFVGGGLFTMLLYWILKRFADNKVKKYMLTIMFILCSVSAAFIIPYLVQTYLDFGWQYLFKVVFHC